MTAEERPPLRTTATPEDRLRFLVGFAGMDLGAARPGDWSNLRDDLAVVLGGKDRFGVKGVAQGQNLSDLGGIIPFVVTPPTARDYPEDALRALQGEVRAMLGTIADRQVGVPRPGQGSVIDGRGTPGCGISDQIPIAVKKWLVVAEPRAGAVVGISGSVRDVLLEMLFLMLSQQPLSPIARCPECHSLFYRVRRQKYCSRQCANRVNQRIYIGKKGHRARKRTADRARRQRRVRQEKGAKNLKVGRP
jgi:hypothetical protein